MMILEENRYRVFASAVFPGNPVTLHEVDTLDDSESMRQRARRSWSEDNGFYMAGSSGPIRARFFSSRGELLMCGHGLMALAQHVAGDGQSGLRPVQTPRGTWALHVDAANPAIVLPALRGRRVDDAPRWTRHMLAGMQLGPQALQALYACPNGVWVAQLHELDQLRRINAATVAAQRVGPVVPGALIAVVALPDAGYGFRYFAPWHGKPEDSGTGSAQCYLAPLFVDAQGHAKPIPVRPYSHEGIAEMCVSLQGDKVRVMGAVHAEMPWSGDHRDVAFRMPFPREG